MKRLVFTSFCVLNLKTVYTEPPSYQEKIRGVYENKIRQNAAPEKIFEIFASIKEGKKFYMSPKDLFRAITPFNYSASVNYDFFEKNESFIIRAVDANKDGRISFPEYFFFIVLLDTPKSKFREFFQNKPRMKLEDFLEMMTAAIKESSQGKKLTHINALDPRSTSITEDDFRESCQNLFEELFKEKDHIVWDDFKNLREKISEELLIYEFHRFNTDCGTISAEDFGKSMISYMPTSLAEMYLSRLESIKPQGRVSIGEYLAFMFAMQEVSLIHQKLLLEHMENGILAKKEITKVFREICENSQYCITNKYSVSELQVEIFIKILDLDDSNTLEPEEIIHLITSRASDAPNRSTGEGFQEVVTEFKRFVNALSKFSGLGPIFKLSDSN